MESSVLFSGVFNLPWWGYVLAALGLTHITIVSVTVFLHRHQAHRALELHPLASHFFRLWLWMTTGMVTKEWAAIHRKHHAKCETPEDPHSPQQVGINRVLWGGVFLYVKESYNRETMTRYGHGTPDDWLERNVYSRFSILGITLMGAANVMLFGVVPGALILVTQIAWIPFWAAGVINGIGHFWGYRNWQTEDASTNIVPWGIIIGGEELHNNHHAYATSAKLSNKWYEIDLGWGKLRRLAPHDAYVLRSLKGWLQRDEKSLCETERANLKQGLAKSRALLTVYSMRAELASLWERSSASREQLVRQLQDWCHRAEASGIRPLAEFSHRLRCYA